MAVAKRADRLAEAALGVVVVGGDLEVLGVLGPGPALREAGADRDVAQGRLRELQLDKVVCLRPGARMIAERSRTVGTASRAVARSSIRNGSSSFAAGRAATPSGWRSSSAARRLTNVVLALRRNGGSREIARASSELAIADRVHHQVQVVDELRRGRRSARRERRRSASRRRGADREPPGRR